MIQKVFGVRDSKAQAFLQPFFSVNVGSAMRAFADAVNEGGNSMFAKHPEDFILYELGDFDDNSGEMIACNPIKMLGVARDFVVAKPANVLYDKTFNESLEKSLEAAANGK